MGRLEGKVAFITGAARGQGRSHAVTLAREGAQIAAIDICEPIEGVKYEPATQADLDETVRLVEELDQRCVAVKADARNGAQMRAAADHAAKELGGIDIGVVNHGITTIGAWDQLSDEDWDTSIDTNLNAVWRSARAVVPHIIARGGGSLTLTASVAGLRSFAGLPHYVAAKHGVVGLAKALAVELAPHWVRVNALCPGTVSTPMFHNQYCYDIFNGGPGGTRESVVFPSQACLLLPIPWMEAEAMSKAILYLASDDGKYVTGTALPVDAGMNATPPGIPPIAATRLAELSQAAAE